MDHLDYTSGLLNLLTFNRIRSFCPQSLRHINAQPIDFHAFANGQRGWSITEDGDLILATDASDLPTHTSFVQRWLFYELLREFFEPLQDFEISVYQEPVVSPIVRYATTRSLERHLNAWRGIFPSQASLLQPKQLRYLLRIQDILNRARFYAYHYCALKDEDSHSHPIKWEEVEQEVILSILLVGETLSNALRRLQIELGLSHDHWFHSYRFSQGWGYSKAVLGALGTAHNDARQWPEQHVKYLQKRLKNNCNAILLALVYQPNYRDAPVNDSQYRPYHLCPKGCDERVRLPDYSKVLEIIKHGGIPLFVYHRASAASRPRLSLDSYRSKHAPEYFVISHVWAEGFGNPNHNEMPGCILERLAKICPENGELTDVLVPDNSAIRSRPFWIDTLGIPVGNGNKAVRQQAIRNMHNVYRKARFALVLDQGTMHGVWNEDHDIAAMRITLSQWTSRLWTLQEALLSEKLYFNFRDMAYSLEALEDSFNREDNHWHKCVAPLSRQYRDSILRDSGSIEFLNRLRNLRSSQGDDKPTKTQQLQIIGKIWRTVQWRHTTHVIHETLALAMIFNLDTAEFDVLNMKNQKRDDRMVADLMQKFIQKLAEHTGAIPVEFLFIPGPHLPHPGFRWAPLTWMAKRPIQHPDAYPLSGVSGNLLQPYGLQVNLPGYELYGLNQNLHRLDNQEEFYFPMHEDLGTWYHVKKAMNPPMPFIADSAIAKGYRLCILCQPEVSEQESQIALLVSVKQGDGEDQKASILSRVEIRWVIKAVDRDNAINSFRARSYDPDDPRAGPDPQGPFCYGVRIRSRQWIVDGVAPRVPENSRLARARNAVSDRFTATMATIWPNSSLSSTPTAISTSSATNFSGPTRVQTTRF